MFEVGRSKSAQVNELKDVESAAPAPIAAEITAERSRSELAQEYAAEALSSLTPEGPNAENFLATGQRFIAGEIVERLAGLLGERTSSKQELEAEEFSKRARQIGNTARETVYSDLSGTASALELDRIGARAAAQAEQELLASTLVEGLDAAIEQSTEGPAANRPQQPQRRRAGIGTRVENLVLATSDYPLAEMYGPGFEMLAETKAAPQTAPERSQEGPSLQDLVVPRGFDRQTRRLEQPVAALAVTPRAIAPAVDYSSADLSTLSMTVSTGGARSLRLGFTPDSVLDSAREPAAAQRARRAA